MKIRLPHFSFSRRKKKLRAATARRATAPDFDDMSEPNMKLSRALLIVLLLHVVAVAGIIAFNAIKSRQGSTAVTPSIRAGTAKSMTSSFPAVAHHEETKPAHSPAIVTKKAKGPEASAEAGKTYIVAKGDTPVTIAKKFKVPYDDLLAANHIDDPRKLKIGQKLIIPLKKGKKNEG